MVANAGLFEMEVGPTRLEDQGPLVPQDYSDELFNDFGCVIRAKMETGEDVHLWMFLYRQIGDEMIIDNDCCQTFCLAEEFSEREKAGMSDTRYICQGQNIDDYHKVGTMTQEINSERTEWKLAGRVIASDAEGWHVTGEHAGVKCDLKLKQRGDAFYHLGKFENLSEKKEGLAGYVVHATATGTITVRGKEMKIAEGYAVNERIIQSGRVPPRMVYMSGRGVTWLHSWGKQMSFYMMNADLGPSSTFMLNIDGKTLVANDAKNAWNEECGTWKDPKTNQVNPCKWHVWANLPEGRLDAYVSAYGRGFYTWTRRGGIVLVHQYVADSTMKFTRTDGSVVEEKGIASIEYMRTLYNQAANHVPAGHYLS